MHIRGIIAAAICGVTLAVLASIPALADPGGTWLTQSGETKVHIASCGGALCGTVVWQKIPGNDTRNPDASKRGRPIVGIQMIYGMKPSGANQWTGQLYNFQDGKTYSGKMSMNGSKLNLAGCVMGGLICKSQTWTKTN